MSQLSGVRDPEREFEARVLTGFRLYSGLFLGLPFERLRPLAQYLPVFADHCRRLLRENVAPTEIVDRFFGENPMLPGVDRLDALFLFVQFVERQIVLFDALEEANFSHVRDFDGPGSVTAFVEAAARDDRQAELAALLARAGTRIVLTAHPTQFYPETVHGIIDDLRRALGERDADEVERLLVQLGKTRFSNRTRPTPLEEATRVSDVVSEILYRVLPEIISRVLIAAFGRESFVEHLPATPNLQVGFWPGGDRDGNPLVTAEVTEEVSRLLRRRALQCHLDTATALAKRLTFEGAYEAVLALVARLRATAEIGCKLFDTRAGVRDYSDSGELMNDLRQLRQLVLERHGGLFVEHVDDLIVKVHLFGFHLASLDLRQSSDVLLANLVELLAHPSCAAVLPGADRISRAERPPDVATLASWLAADVTLPDRASEELTPLARDTLLTLRAIPEIQRRNGVAGLHRFIVSHTHGPEDVLVVLVLARLSGLAPDALELDIVPLFESISDLERAESTVRELFQCAVYRDHLRRRGRRQTVMLGFSDGTKDGGYLAANVAIRAARRRLTALGRAHGIELVFFDGRGGPPARGGGNTHSFYRSRDHRIEQYQQQLTIQGQTISTNFGSPELARYHVEQLFTANLENLLWPSAEEDPPVEHQPLLDELAAVAWTTYRDLREDPNFIDFLVERSPLPLFEWLTIGSRPVARRRTERLDLEQLRAIPFVATWSVLKLQVPGYYGVGTALTRALDAGRGDQLRRLYRESLFFRALLDSAAMSLTKSRIDLHAHLESDPRFGDLIRRIREETERSRSAIVRISQRDRLKMSDPVNRRSVEAREEIMLPLLVIVQAAYVRYRELQRAGGGGAEESEQLRKLALKGIAAIINATRNAA
jgi:phosphoenolpyruvate carboxylase